MAIFCLATDLHDLKRRLGNIIVGQTARRKPVRAGELKAAGAMAVLLKDAIAPNLVQTLENNPAFIHGGPFANIAHGCNSVIATTTALKLADYVVTEAGFGADLGAEKFFDIKCRKAGLKPDAAVVVATVRALKMHGGVRARPAARRKMSRRSKRALPTSRAISKTCASSACRRWSRSTASAPTPRPSTTGSRSCAPREGVEAVIADHWAHGGEGAAELAERGRRARRQRQGRSSSFSIPTRCRCATRSGRSRRSIYGARDIACDSAVENQLAELQKQRLRPFPGVHRQDPVQLFDRPQRQGRAERPHPGVREIRLSAGAEFVVAVCGEIMTMPGLPRVPAANNIDLTEDGRITGLF